MRSPVPLMIIALVISSAPILSLYYIGGKSFINDMKYYGGEYNKAMEDAMKDYVEEKCLNLREKIENEMGNYEKFVKDSLDMVYKVKIGEFDINKNYEVFWAYPDLLHNLNQTRVAGLLNGSYTNDEYENLLSSLNNEGRIAFQSFLTALNNTNLTLNKSLIQTNSTIYNYLQIIVNQSGILLHNFIYSIMNENAQNILNESLTKYSYIAEEYNETIFLKWLNITISPNKLNPIYNAAADEWVKNAKGNGYWYLKGEDVFLSMKYPNIFAQKKVDALDFQKILSTENYDYSLITTNLYTIWSNDLTLEGKNVSEELAQYVIRYEYVGTVIYENGEYYIAVKTLHNSWRVVILEKKGNLRIENIKMMMDTTTENYRREFFFVLSGSIVSSELIAFFYFYYDTTLKFKLYSKFRNFRKRKIRK